MSRRADGSHGSADWRYVRTEPQTGAWNMACDEVLGESVVSAGIRPVLRFFQWRPAAISFGYGQHISREIQLERARADGVDVVRRVTGGRAVLHADELTYSLICREDDPVAAGGITATYSRISEGLALGLRRIDIDAVLARATDPVSRPGAGQAAIPCFGSTARAEIVVSGRKLVGSAQHRMRGLMIQHGSVLVGPDHRKLVDYLSVPEKTRAGLARRIAQGTTSLRELGWTGSSPAEIADVLASALSDCLGMTLKQVELTPDQEAATANLAQDKYAAEWWNFREARRTEHAGEPVE